MIYEVIKKRKIHKYNDRAMSASGCNYILHNGQYLKLFKHFFFTCEGSDKIYRRKKKYIYICGNIVYMGDISVSDIYKSRSSA